jgi:hypothetical protein
MAETTAPNRPETVSRTVLDTKNNTVRPAPNKGGRPRADGKPPGDATVDPKPGMVKADFFAWIKSFPQKDWDEALTLYLYRTAPELNMARRGQMNIQKFNRPVDPDDVMQLHGSGGYKFILNRYDSKTGQSGAVQDHYFQVMNMEHPPRVPYGSWIDRPENSDWLWAKPALLKALQDANNSVNGGGGGSPTLAQVAELIERIRPNNSPEEQATLASMVVEIMGKQNEQVMLMANPDRMLGVVDKVIATMGAKGDGNSAVVDLLKDQLNRMHQELMEERKTARENSAAVKSAPTLKEALQEQKEMIELMGFKRGGASSTDWGSVAIELGRDVLKGLTQVGTAFAQLQIQKANLELQRKHAPPAAAAPAARPAPAAATAAAAIAAPEPAAPPVNGAPAPASELTPEGQDMIANISAQFAQLFDGAAPFLADHFRKGWSGMEFREWFLDTYGRMGLNAVRAMSKETLIGVLEHRKANGPPHVQELLFELNPPEKLALFVDEFLSDRPIPDDDDEEPTEGNSEGQQQPAAGSAPARRNAQGAKDSF